MDADGKNEFEKRVNELLAGVASQIRPSLSTVFECLGTSRDGTIPPLARKSYYNLMRLIGNMSAAEKLAERARFELSDNDLAALCSSLCGDLAPAIARERGVALAFSCRNESVIVACEPEMMERLLLNLLSNAAKYTPRGGKITVELRSDRTDVFLTVADTGPGIPAEKLKNLFSRYLSPPDPAAAGDGLGLGLPICRRIAEGHGGRIFVESSPRGTRVTAAIPNIKTGRHTVEEPRFDYAGGYDHVLVEMSDVLEAEDYEM
jgi:signal transduction histidine kinase